MHKHGRSKGASCKGSLTCELSPKLQPHLRLLRENQICQTHAISLTLPHQELTRANQDLEVTTYHHQS